MVKSGLDLNAHSVSTIYLGHENNVKYSYLFLYLSWFYSEPTPFGRLSSHTAFHQRIRKKMNNRQYYRTTHMSEFTLFMFDKPDNLLTRERTALHEDAHTKEK